MFPSWLHEFDPSFWSPVRRTSAPSPLLRPRRRVEQQLLQRPALEQAPIEDLPPALVAVDRQSQPSSVAAGRRSIPITYLGYTDPAQSLDFKVKRREQRQLRRAAACVPAEAAYSDDTHAESENDDDHEGQADAVEHARHAVKPITREPEAGATNEPESLVDDAVSRCVPAGGLAAFDSSLRRHLGLRIVPVYPDGNCLFSSAAMQLFGDPAQYRRVREAVCAYMRGDIPSTGPSPRQQATATKGRTVLFTGTDPIPVRCAAAIDPTAVARSADARQQTRSFFQRLISMESGVEDVDIDTYCDEYMGWDGSWGGYPELVALEEWSDRPVEIFTLPRDPFPGSAALHAREDGSTSNAAGGASQSQSVAGRIGSAILSAASTAAGAAGGIAAAAMSMASGSASAGGKGRESMSVQTVDGDIRAASGSACCDGEAGQPPQMLSSTSTIAGGDGGGPNSGGSLTGELEWSESQCAPKSIHFAGELPTEQLQGVEPLRFCYSSGNHYDAVMPVSDLQVLAEYQDPEQCYADDDAWDAMMTVDDEDDVDGGGQQAEGQQRKVMAGIYMLPRPAAAGGAGDGGSPGPGGRASVLRRVPITGGGDDDDYIDKEELRDAFEHEAPPLLPAHSAASGTRWIRYRVVAAPPRPSMAIRASRLQRVAATATPAANQPQQCVASTASGVLSSPIEL